VPLVAQQICWRGDSTFIQVSKLAVEVDLQTVRWSRSKHAQFVDLLLQNAFLLAERANDLDVLARRIALQRRGLVSRPPIPDFSRLRCSPGVGRVRLWRPFGHAWLLPDGFTRSCSHYATAGASRSRSG
jgi:hypothetical protein